MQHAIKRQARLGLLLAIGASACTSSNGSSSGPSDSSLPVDASDEAVFSATDDGACTSTASVQASSFDQSCVSDVDCVAVGQGNVCAVCGFACPSGAINKGATAAYQAAAIDAGVTTIGPCHCPDFGTPCCHQGQCSLTCDDDITDIDACVSAGGACVPYAPVLEGGLPCVRISYCAADPAAPSPTYGVCCPAAVADGGTD
jgi:hypothetical protein